MAYYPGFLTRVAEVVNMGSGKSVFIKITPSVIHSNYVVIT